MIGVRAKQLAAPIPEFVDANFVANYIRKDMDYIKRVQLLEKVPFRYDEKGRMIYRWNVVKYRIDRYRLNPPPFTHPNHEMSQAETMVYVGITGSTHFVNHIKKGHIPTHKNAQGQVRIYLKDAERFLRTFARKYLVMNMTEPLILTDAAMVLGITVERLKREMRRLQLKCEPRKPRQKRRVSQATMLKYLEAHSTHPLRVKPMPDYMPRAVAKIYSAAIPQVVNAVKASILVPEQYVKSNGKVGWGVRKEHLDETIDKLWASSCYGKPNKPFYSRKNIWYKFGKSDAWIDTFISGKCPLVDRFGDEIPAGFGRRTYTFGWKRESVEDVVNSGVEYYPEIYVPKKIYKPEHKKYTRPKEVIHKTLPAVDVIEYALENAYSEREFAKEEHAREVMRKRNAKYAEREAIREEMGFTPAKFNVTRSNVLRYSTEREIIALVYNHGAKNIFKDRSLSKWDLAVFIHDVTLRFRRQVKKGSITRLIERGIRSDILKKVQVMPEWVIIVAGTSIVNDLNLHDTLRSVPKDVMAVAPFGYEYRFFDGTWTNCPNTYGYYQKYTLNPPTNELVVGTKGVNGEHYVDVLDGPFVAVRGECLDNMREILYFNELGECRSMVGPIISAICRRHKLKMMQVSVSSSECASYRVPIDSPKWHQLEDVVKKYENATEAGIQERKEEGIR